jgi:hypothetical protein
MRAKRTKSGKKTGLETFRSRPQQERMAHKKRLGLRRQEFVSVTFMTPTSCVSLMWITGRIRLRALMPVRCRASGFVFRRRLNSSQAHPIERAIRKIQFTRVII